MQVEQAESGGCPSENTVAALFDQTLAPDRRAAVGDHVDTCDTCRRLVAVLAQSRMQTTVLGKRVRFARASEASPEARALLEPGAALGRYRIERLLGQGGMGVVYAAFDPELGRRVAVKVIRPELARYGALIAARLAREARAMAQVAHPNVIAVYDVGSGADEVFVAMELVEGRTLRDWLREGERSWRDVLEVFRAAGEGLAAAHDARLIHRDFKPDNVLIDRAGRVRVSDFGLARALAEEAAQGSDIGIAAGSGTLELTRTGATVGTPAYMAPEQHGHRATDERSDQFSFCVALWEAVYGERPFPGDNALELADAVENGRRRPAPRRKAPGWLRRALERGLEVDPAARFPSMGALLRAIRPRRSRLVWGAAAAAGLVALAAGGGSLLLAGDGRGGSDPAALVASCAAMADGKMAEVWSARRRAAVLRALTARGGDGERWQLVVRGLDRYAASWKDMQRDACEAGARGAQSALLVDLRAHCLETRLADFDVVLGLLETDEPVVLEQALESVGALASLDRCSAVEVIEARTPVPRDPRPARRGRGAAPRAGPGRRPAPGRTIRRGEERARGAPHPGRGARLQAVHRRRPLFPRRPPGGDRQGGRRREDAHRRSPHGAGQPLRSAGRRRLDRPHRHRGAGHRRSRQGGRIRPARARRARPTGRRAHPPRGAIPAPHGRARLAAQPAGRGARPLQRGAPALPAARRRPGGAGADRRDGAGLRGPGPGHGVSRAPPRDPRRPHPDRRRRIIPTPPCRTATWPARSP